MREDKSGSRRYGRFGQRRGSEHEEELYREPLDAVRGGKVRQLVI